MTDTKSCCKIELTVGLGEADMKRKITEISVFEFFMCMFVILIHLLSEGVDAFPKWSFPSILFSSLTRLATFAVPGFVFTSGLKLFYKYGDRKHFPYPKFLWDRAIKIVIPYCIVVVIYYLVFSWGMDLYDFSWDQLWYFLITGNVSAQFYFVILILQFYLLMPIWIYFSRTRNKAFGGFLIVFTFILTVLCRMYFPFAEGIHKVFPSYLIFWILGMYAGLHYEGFEAFIKQNKLMIYIGWLVLAIIHCALSYMEHAGLIYYEIAPLIVVLFCLFAIFGFYSYARELTESLERNGKGLLTSISQASYDIYLLHCLVIVFMNWMMTKMEMDDILKRFFINFAVTYLVSIIFCVLESTIYTNVRASYLRASATRARKMARRKRYL